MPDGFKIIIAAVNPEDALAVPILRAARAEAEAHDANLTIIAAYPPSALMTPPPAVGGLGAGDIATPSAQRRELEMEERRVFEAKLKSLVETEAPGAHVHVEFGSPEEIVVDHAGAAGADLIVIGSHQRSFWEALLTGAQDQSVTKRADSAVLVVTKGYAERET